MAEASTIPLQVTQEELDRIRQCEAVVVHVYETASGDVFSRAVAWGDRDEMQDAADTPGMFIVPVGVSIRHQEMLLVSDLLGPSEETPS
jgi:hypothetical protein